MNRKRMFLTIFIMGFLVSSILVSDLSKAIVASDKLVLEVGNSVEGKLLYTNASVSDELANYPSLIVEDIFTLTDVSLEVIQIKYDIAVPATGTDPLDMGEITDFEMTQLILKDNRTTLLPAARLYLGNSTDNYEMTLLGVTTYDELTDFNRTKITFANGSSYIWEDYYGASIATEIGGLMFIFMLLNLGFAIQWTYTLLAISPTANVGDNINYYNTYTDDFDLGEVIDKPAVTTTDGDSFDTIHVHYVNTSVFGFWDAPDVHAYYEASTGLLIRIVEKDGVEQYEFVPGTVDIGGGIGFTPYSTIGIIVSILSAGILVLYIRRKK
jgi:hypothetical protein